MKRITLGKTNIETSSLGFGCVQLTAHHSIHEALNALECAYEVGITHFDVARSYGFGRCEGILSNFLKNKRNHVTIATKFGINPPSGFLGNKKLISFSKKMLKPFPGVLQRTKNHGAAMVKNGHYNPDDMISSLEKSLRELQTDYVDIFLLHEAEIEDARNESLILALEQQVKKGKIRCFGIASDFSRIENHLSAIPAVHQLLQFNDNALEQNKQKIKMGDKKIIITHSIFKPLESLLKAIKENETLTKQFSQKINVDLSDSDTVNSFLLHYALQINPDGIVLFSSKKNNHIKKNVENIKQFQCSDQELLEFCIFAKNILSNGV